MLNVDSQVFKSFLMKYTKTKKCSMNDIIEHFFLLKITFLPQLSRPSFPQLLLTSLYQPKRLS
jgi:hypothetical protein